MKRFLRILAIVGITAAALVTLSTASNLVLGAVERSSIRPYGETVRLARGDVNVSVAGSGEQAVVLLSGYGTAAPTLDFAPLVDELQAYYTVVVVERFGYGYSDLGVTERTVKNISNELHDVLAELDVHQPIMIAHSLAGIYSLDYVNRFPGEVSALVTIDSSVPEDFAVPAERSYWESVLATSGVVRWAIMLDPAIAAPSAPAGVYSEDQIEQIRLIAAAGPRCGPPPLGSRRAPVFLPSAGQTSPALGRDARARRAGGLTPRHLRGRRRFRRPSLRSDPSDRVNRVPALRGSTPPDPAHPPSEELHAHHRHRRYRPLEGCAGRTG